MGPLWATSAFSFESHNGFLAKIVHGTKNMGQEMMNNLKFVEGANIIKTKVKRRNISPNKKMYFISNYLEKPLGIKIILIYCCKLTKTQPSLSFIQE